MGQGGIGSSSGQLIKSIRVGHASPRCPISFTATVNGADAEVIDLAWVDNTVIDPQLRAIGYRIERKNGGAYTFLTDILNPQTLVFADRTLVSDTYTYRIRSFIANPAPASLWCSEASATSVVFAGVLSLTTDGLIFRDQFDRVDSDDVGNGWTDRENDPEGIRLRGFNGVVESIAGLAEQSADRVAAGLPDDMIVQANGTPSGSPIVGFNLVIRTDSAAPMFDNDGYYLRIDNIGADEINLWEIVGGSVIQTATPFATAWGTKIGLRLIVEVSGSDLLIRGYDTIGLPNLQDLTKEFTERVSLTDTSPIPNDATHNKLSIGLKNWGRIDEYIAMGRNVVCTGLPTDHQVEIDSRGKVAEVGGTVTIDMDTFAVPFTDFKLYDADDVLLDTITPADGFFGGAVFVAS